MQAFRLEAEILVKGNRVDVGFSYRQLDAGEPFAPRPPSLDRLHPTPFRDEQRVAFRFKTSDTERTCGFASRKGNR